jgi:dihydrofolate reductase
MGKVILNVSMSLDGFIAGPDDAIEPLLEWTNRMEDNTGYQQFLRPTGRSSEVIREMVSQTGAIVTGGRTYEAAIRCTLFPSIQVPCFIVSGRTPELIPVNASLVVTRSIRKAIEKAKEAAGDKHVSVIGGSDIAQQCLEAGLLDEIQVHLVPVILGKGTRLFGATEQEQVQLVRTREMESPGVTHLWYTVMNKI